MGINRLGYRIGNAELPDDMLGDEKGHEVEESRPKHRLERRQNLGRDNSGYGVGRIVEAIDKIEHQAEKDNGNQ